MTQTDIATIIASYTGVTVVIAGVVWRIFKHSVNAALDERQEIIRPSMEELKHNGGSSLLDVVKLQILPMVKELRDNQIEVQAQQNRLEGRLDQYIADSKSRVVS
jgi:hypothetical protein